MSMALQDYVKEHLFLDDDILFPYMMQPAIQIGKFQNAYEEINQPYMDKHNIKLIRRETGGGAIYMDDQNMSFSFLFTGDNNINGNYARLRSEEHTSELQSRGHLVCRLLLEK